MNVNCYLYCLAERSRGHRSLWRLDETPGDLRANHGHGLYLHQHLLMRPRRFMRVNLTCTAWLRGAEDTGASGDWMILLVTSVPTTATASTSTSAFS
jgi:hypothetical protein